MPFSVNDIKSQALVGGGARPNLFNVSLTFPEIASEGGRISATAARQQSTFSVKGAQLPGSDLGMIEIPYFGRTVKVAGNRTFPEWTTTVINDEGFIIWNAISIWMNGINGHVRNIRSRFPHALGGNLGYQTDSFVTHFGKEGGVIKRIHISNMWPSVLAPVDLAWETNDAIEEYTVTWQYDYWSDVESTDFPTVPEVPTSIVV